MPKRLKNRSNKGKFLFCFALVLGGIVLFLSLLFLRPQQFNPAMGGMRQNWSFSGWRGKYQIQQLQHGFLVFHQICASCHSLRYVPVSSLKNLNYSDAQISSFIPQGKSGEGIKTFPLPFVDEQTARDANGGVVPPDLSNIIQQYSLPVSFPQNVLDLFTDYTQGGADYINALLMGYKDPPAQLQLPEGAFYNPYFSGGSYLRMPPPLYDDAVDYGDNKKHSAQQYAKDVSAFLAWCADPYLGERKKIGLVVLTLLLISCALLFLLKKQIFQQLNRDNEEE